MKTLYLKLINIGILQALILNFSACKKRNEENSSEKALAVSTVVGDVVPTRYPSSFNFVKSKVYSRPLSVLPKRPGLSKMELLKLMATSIGELTIRSSRTLVDEADFKEDGPKWLHPAGVCADLTWKITEPSPATGLFATGTKVNGIVRFSSGTAETEYTDAGRIFGMGIKLFPTQDSNKQVISANIQTLDYMGFERTNRKSFFKPDPGSKEKVYFTNVAPAKSLVGKTLSGFFDRFDLPNFARPVYAAAIVNGDESVATNPKTPYEVRFYPKVLQSARFTADFREEILQYRESAIVFDIEIYRDSTKLLEKIGEVTVGQPVMSDVCDLSLHFHHSPNENQVMRHNYDSPGVPNSVVKVLN